MRRIAYLLAALLLALMWPTSLLSQGRSQELTHNRYIHGEVRLPNGERAGVGMYVVIESDASGGYETTQTDSSGKFSFMSLGNVRYRVRVRAPGFEEESQEIDLSATPMGYLKFTLRAKPETGLPQPISGAVANPAFPPDMPESAQKQFRQGFEIFSSGNKQKSISHFKKAADDYPKYAPTYYYLGVAQAANKDFEAAVPTLQKCIALNEKAAEPMIVLGSIYNSQKKYADAEKVLTSAVAIAPRSFDAHKELAKALLATPERTSAAEDHLRKAVSLNNESVEAHILLGNVLLRKHDNEGALKEYQESLRIDPKGPMAGPTKEVINKIENAKK